MSQPKGNQKRRSLAPGRVLGTRTGSREANAPNGLVVNTSPRGMQIPRAHEKNAWLSPYPGTQEEEDVRALMRGSRRRTKDPNQISEQHDRHATPERTPRNTRPMSLGGGRLSWPNDWRPRGARDQIIGGVREEETDMIQDESLCVGEAEKGLGVEAWIVVPVLHHSSCIRSASRNGRIGSPVADQCDLPFAMEIRARFDCVRWMNEVDRGSWIVREVYSRPKHDTASPFHLSPSTFHLSPHTSHPYPSFHPPLNAPSPSVTHALHRPLPTRAPYSTSHLVGVPLLLISMAPHSSTRRPAPNPGPT